MLHAYMLTYHRRFFNTIDSSFWHEYGEEPPEAIVRPQLFFQGADTADHGSRDRSIPPLVTRCVPYWHSVVPPQGPFHRITMLPGSDQAPRELRLFRHRWLPANQTACTPVLSVRYSPPIKGELLQTDQFY